MRYISDNFKKHINEVNQMQTEHNDDGSLNVNDLKTKQIRVNMQM
jgi:hypothetical protein